MQIAISGAVNYIDRIIDRLRSDLDKIEQAVLTTTDLKLFSPIFIEKAVIWQVESGTVRNRSGV